MVLVDTSIWISHLREGNVHLRELLLDGAVLCHPSVVGEISLGHLRNRNEVLSLLQALPRAKAVENDELLSFIETRRLMGTGVGLVDAHLLASALLTNVQLWTTDTPLRRAAVRLGVLYQ
ncbi:MAG: type II toxin-antitoxin system VapC family toxin [Nitrospirota bacterium]